MAPEPVTPPPVPAVFGFANKKYICFPKSNCCVAKKGLHTWARGEEERGGMHPPWGSKTNPLPCTTKKGTHHKKILDIFYFIPPCLAFLLFFLRTEKLQQFAKDWKTHCLFSSKQLVSYMCKIFFPFPLSPLFTQATTAKNITSPIANFDPCKHKKILPPLYEKSGAHVLAQVFSISWLVQEHLLGRIRSAGLRHIVLKGLNHNGFPKCISKIILPCCTLPPCIRRRSEGRPEP